MTVRILVGSVLMSVALATATAAQSPGTVEVGAFGREAWFDDQLRLEDKAGGGGTLGVFLLQNFALEAEGTYVKTTGPLGNDVSNVRVLGRLVYNVPLGGYASAIQIGGGYARYMWGETADADEDAVHAMVGLRIGFTENLALRVAGTVDVIPSPKLLVSAKDNYNHGAQAGLSLLFGNSYDKDKDGVKDKQDKCPGTPMGEPADQSGCSASQRDSDGDKVKDNADKCPNTPAGTSVDAEGCSAAQKDADGDRVQDNADKCANTPAGEEVDANGCSASQRDSDGDGVKDNVDKCADTPAGEQVNASGCSASQLDSDSDGVSDAKDRCANTPSGVQVDAVGCRILFREAQRSITLEGVLFETGKSTIGPQTEVVLRTVAEALVANPDIRGEVAGHTDNTGSAKLNQRLSLARAEAVRQYFITHGVAADRMTAVGYGASKPVASNKTAEGRALNRRVELIRTSAAPK
jgi:outer membrane protein OmpA-like peptidoglycan-associated protein